MNSCDTWELEPHVKGCATELTCHVFAPFSVQVSARSPAPTATGPSPTAPTCELICRPTPRWRSTSAASALAPSAACLCCRNTAPRGVVPPRCDDDERDGAQGSGWLVDTEHGSTRAHLACWWPVGPQRVEMGCFKRPGGRLILDLTLKASELLCSMKKNNFHPRLASWGWTNADSHFTSVPLLLLCPFQRSNMYWTLCPGAG